MTRNMDQNPDEAEEAPRRSERPWKAVALTVGGGVILVMGAVVATLAVTHDSAVKANFQAYLNGIITGAESGGYLDGFDDGFRACKDDIESALGWL